MSEENISLKVDACLKLADDIQNKLGRLINGSVPEEEKRSQVGANLEGISVGLSYLEKILQQIAEGDLVRVDGYILHGAECKLDK